MWEEAEQEDEVNRLSLETTQGTCALGEHLKLKKSTQRTVGVILRRHFEGRIRKMEVILESLGKDDPFSIFKGPGTSPMTGEGSLSSQQVHQQIRSPFRCFTTVFFDVNSRGPSYFRNPSNTGKSKTKDEMSRKTTRGTENKNKNNKKENLN